MESDALEVNAEDLMISAATVDVHAANLQSTHATTDYRIDAALSGLPTLAAAAMEAKAAEWHVTSTALTSRLSTQAAALFQSAARYTDTDAANADALRQVVTSLRFT